MINKNIIEGAVTLEDEEYLEIEIDDAIGNVKLILFSKSAYPYLRMGDIVEVHLKKVDTKPIS